MVTKVNKNQTTMGESDWSLLDFGDLPNDYVGREGQALVVNPTEDGMVFAAVGGGGVVTFASLTDTPEDYTEATPNGMVLVNGAGNGLVFGPVPTDPPAPMDFLDLEDVDPITYSGFAGQVVRVNVGETGLEFSPASGVANIADLGDVDPLGAEGTLAVVGTGPTLTFVAPIVAIPNNTYSFDGLSDTPALEVGKYLRVATGGALEWAVIDSINTFSGLGDTPSAQEMGLGAGKVLTVNGSGGISLTTPSSGVTTFSALSDTPVTMAGQGGKTLKVSQDQTVEFVEVNKIPLILDITTNTGEVVAGVGSYRFVAPTSMTIESVSASVTTAPTGGSLTVDINVDGVSILSGPMTIPNAATVSDGETALLSPSIAAGQVVTVDVDGISGTPAGLKVYMVEG